MYKMVKWFFLLGWLATTAQAAQQSELDEAAALLTELRAATTAMLVHIDENSQRAEDFVYGRLLDMAIADYARRQELDQTVAYRARKELEERTRLVEAAMTAYLEDEKKKLPPLADLARQRYMADREKYRVPEQIRLAHILLKADVERNSEEEIAAQKDKAQQLLARLAQGDDFAALAQEFSEEAETAEKGGELPRWAERGSFVPPFERAVWELKPGQVSGIVRTRFGYHLIKLLDYKEAEYQPFEKIRNQLIGELENELTSARRSKFIDSFRGAALDAKAAALVPEVRQAIRQLLAEKMPANNE